MADNQERNICDLINKLAMYGFDQNEVELILKVMRSWAFLKDGDEINAALCRGSVMVDHANAFRNAMKIKD